MQTFDDFLNDEMAQPVTVTNPKTKERTQLQPLRDPIIVHHKPQQLSLW